LAALWTLVPATLLAATISGVMGMGGGTLLVAIMASFLRPLAVVPIHGVVQLCSNSARGLLLWRHVVWRLFLLYLPGKIVGILIAREFYVGQSQPWFRPAIGAFVLAFLLWDRFRPPSLHVPRWLFAVAGVGGGFLTIVVGVSGPYLSAFFLGGDLRKEEIVATKASIQIVGHLAKVPVFLSLGFSYRESLPLLLPLLAASLVGSWVGTRLLRGMRPAHFDGAFRVILLLLAMRLILFR
jgi:uncharacterized membrane protein YfcA